jgi:uncharacterized protein (TIGR02284 family)
MKSEEVIKELQHLVHSDIDTVNAYKTVLDEIDEPEIYNSITLFQEDHIRHIKNLSTVIAQLGGKVPEFKVDLLGLLMQGLTSMRSITGVKGALAAMKSNEEHTMHAYQKALSMDLPLDLRQLLIKNYEEVKRHYQYIQQTLSRPYFN